MLRCIQELKIEQFKLPTLKIDLRGDQLPEKNFMNWFLRIFAQKRSIIIPRSDSFDSTYDCFAAVDY